MREKRLDHGPLQSDIEIDVAVVGAGISGALVAQTLAEAGYGVAVFDRRGVVQGSTAASTALLQYEIDTPMQLLAQRIGAENTTRAWHRSKLAVDALRERIIRLKINCDLQHRNSLYLAGNVLNAKALLKEADSRKRAGFETEFLDANMLDARFGIERNAALLSFGNLTVNPRKLALGLLQHAIDLGAKIHAPEEIVHSTETRNYVKLQTASGRTVRCKHLIYATGYELADIVPATDHQMISTWALATAPQPSRLWPEQCLIWEASDPYLYLRTTSDGRIIIGGEDEEFEDENKRDKKIPAKTATLLRKLKKMFPDVKAEAEYAWAGCFGSSSTGLPIVGRIPGLNRSYSLMGYGGNGITFSMLGAQMLLNAIKGRDEFDKDLFGFR